MVGWVVVAIVVIGDGEEELRVVGCNCGSLFPTCAMGIIYFFQIILNVYAKLAQLVVSLQLTIVQSLIPFIDIPTLFTLISLHQLQLIPIIIVSPMHWSYCSILVCFPLSVVCCLKRVTVFHWLPCCDIVTSTLLEGSEFDSY